jgi:predicted O-methyltransferase YrrM
MIKQLAKALLPKRVWARLRGIRQRQHYQHLSALGGESANEWIRKSATIPGWLNPGEHEFLWELAACAREGDILEIGSWMGKSTCILAGACVATAPQTRVICVDTFTMTGTAEQEQYHHVLVGSLAGTFYLFLQNARRLGFGEHVVPIAAPSAAAVPLIGRPLRLAFIDGTHDFENAARDVELAFDKLAVGGVLALHDAVGSAWPEVTRYVDSYLRPSPLLRLIGQACTVVAFEKVASGSLALAQPSGSPLCAGAL